MKVLCDYCKREAILVPDTEIYNGNSYGGMVYLCKLCDAYVGCHKEGSSKGKPYGRLANSELREYKVNAHKAFDVLWKSGEVKRGDAYAWLASEMGLEKDLCHIGMFGVTQCKQVIDLCSKVPEILCKGKQSVDKSWVDMSSRSVNSMGDILRGALRSVESSK